MSLKDIVFEAAGVKRIRSHLERFGEFAPNNEMLSRLERVVTGELEPSIHDALFYTHELREACRYGARGWATGTPSDEDDAHRLWDTEHTCSLEEFGVNEKRYPLYHPNVLPW